MPPTCPPRANRWALVVAAGLVIFMAQLDTTIVIVALPAIAKDFGATTTVAEWVALGYVVPLIALTLLSGRWLDGVGHRDALLIGTVGFALASIAAGLAPTIGLLIAARLVQGAMAAVLLSLAPVLAVEAVSAAARGRALSVVSTLAPLGAVSGPVLGGQLVDAAGWAWIFFVNVPIALVVAVVGCRQLGSPGPLQMPRAEWLAEAALLGGAAVALLLALSMAPGHGPAWLLALLAVPPLVAGWRRTETSRPVRRLVTSPGMTGLHVALLTSYAALLLVQFLAPFYLHQTLGISAAATGLTMLAYPVATAVVGPLSGALTDRRGARNVAATGAAVLTAGLMLLVPLGEDWQPGDLAWRLVVVGVGFGLFVTPIQSIAMTLAPCELLGTTSASTNLARQLGIAVGPAIGTAAWAASGYALDGMRAAFALAAGLSATAVLALTRAPARSRRSPQLVSCPDYQQ